MSRGSAICAGFRFQHRLEGRTLFTCFFGSKIPCFGYKRYRLEYIRIRIVYLGRAIASAQQERLAGQGPSKTNNKKAEPGPGRLCAGSGASKSRSGALCDSEHGAHPATVARIRIV